MSTYAETEEAGTGPFLRGCDQHKREPEKGAMSESSGRHYVWPLMHPQERTPRAKTPRHRAAEAPMSGLTAYSLTHSLPL